MPHLPRPASRHEDHRSGVLHAASGTRLDGAARRRRRISRRKSAGLGADAESASRAGDHCRRAGHQERRCDLPRHPARRRLRPQVEARPGGRSCRAFEATWQARKGCLEPRGRHSSFDFFHSVAAMYMKAAVAPGWQAHRLAAAHGLSADQFNFRRHGKLCRRRDGPGMEQSAVRHSQPSGGERARRLPRAHWMAAQRSQHLSRVRHSFFRRRTRAQREQRPVEYLLDLIGPTRIVDLDLKGDEAEDAKSLSAGHRPPAARGRNSGREVGLGQASNGQRARPGHRRASQLPDLRRHRG